MERQYSEPLAVGVSHDYQLFARREELSTRPFLGVFQRAIQRRLMGL